MLFYKMLIQPTRKSIDCTITFYFNIANLNAEFRPFNNLNNNVLYMMLKYYSTMYLLYINFSSVFKIQLL